MVPEESVLEDPAATIGERMAIVVPESTPVTVPERVRVTAVNTITLAGENMNVDVRLQTDSPTGAMIQ